MDLQLLRDLKTPLQGRIPWKWSQPHDPCLGRARSCHCNVNPQHHLTQGCHSEHDDRLTERGARMEQDQKSQHCVQHDHYQQCQRLCAGKGLEALILVELHLTLLDTRKLNLALTLLQFRAAQLGLLPLFTDNTAIFKLPVTYLATNKKKIFVCIHIPFLDTTNTIWFALNWETYSSLWNLEENFIASNDTIAFGL